MPQLINQAQDDLLADFDVPLYIKKASESPTSSGRDHTNGNEKTWTVHDFSSDDEIYPSLSLIGLVDAIKSHVAKDLERLLNVDLAQAIQGHLIQIADFLKDTLYHLPMHEHELQYVSSIGLMCYGGSWTYLCGFIAAVEVFDTVKVLEEACSVCSMPFTSFSPQKQELTPMQIKQSIRAMGLQFALLLVVGMSPSIAEICIIIAFASKIICFLPMKKILQKSSSPNVCMADAGDCRRYDEWLDQISFALAFILSLLISGCFPQLVVAMYMCSLGVSIFFEAYSDPNAVFTVSHPFSAVLFDVDLRSWMLETSRYQKWGFITMMSLWQTWYGYKGLLQFLSWFIFLFPAVKLYKFCGVEA